MVHPGDLFKEEYRILHTVLIGGVQNLAEVLGMDQGSSLNKIYDKIFSANTPVVGTCHKIPSNVAEAERYLHRVLVDSNFCNQSMNLTDAGYSALFFIAHLPEIDSSAGASKLVKYLEQCYENHRIIDTSFSAQPSLHLGRRDLVKVASSLAVWTAVSNDFSEGLAGGLDWM